MQTVLNNPLPGRQFKYLQNALINFLVSLIFCDGRQWHKSLHYDSLVLIAVFHVNDSEKSEPHTEDHVECLGEIRL